MQFIHFTALGLAAVLMSEAAAVPPEAPRAVDAPAKPTNRTRRRPRREPAPPPCRVERPGPPAAPVATSMPEFFARMGQSFAADPANAFQGILGELAGMEGPALQGIELSPAEERQAGRQAREQYLTQAAARGFAVVDDPRKLAYLRALVESLATHMQHRDRYPDLDITLIDAPVPDGQGFPGGFLVFTTGLLDEPDEATVAAVVAHELAHLDNAHLYNYARRARLAEATFVPGPGGPADFDRMFTRQMALLGLMMNPFRPEDEDEADCTAATWMFLDGYDPRALVGYFERLHDRLGDAPAAPGFAFGRSHPYTLDRRRHVLARLEQLHRWRPRQEVGLYAQNLKDLTPKAESPAKDEK